MATFIVDVGVIGPFNANQIANIDISIHVIADHYAFGLSNFQEFFISLGSWVEPLINEATKSNLNDLQQDIALVCVIVCYRILEICDYRD